MTSKEFDRRFSGITPKPRHVILQLLQGKKDDEISLEMESAVTTIRKHIENLCDLFEIPGEIDGIKRRRRDLLTALFLNGNGNPGKSGLMLQILLVEKKS
jgi:hypothetical protein